MFSKPIKLWGNGAITIPKKWREKWGTDSFMLEENAKGYLVIKPISLTDEKDDILYWEGDDGSCGLHFPGGMPADEVLRRFQEANNRLNAEEQQRS